MSATKLFHTAILVAALAEVENTSVVTVAETTATVIAVGLAKTTQQLQQLTTVGLSTVTVFSNQQKPPQTTVTFTPENSVASLEVTMTPVPGSQLSQFTNSVLVNTGAVSNLTVAAANFTWPATTSGATASSAVITGASSLAVSSATQPGPTTANSTNQAAETNILVGRSLKAMAACFLLALAL